MHLPVLYLTSDLATNKAGSPNLKVILWLHNNEILKKKNQFAL